ncbi:MAG: ABC transporter permease [Muribaculaceae bacterium]|nr:ABC transporter permease [Muribaculaceae bacterium]
MYKERNKKISWLRQVCETYVRELRNIFKDEGIMIFFFLLPLAYPIVYSLIYNPEVVRDVPMVVIDNDRTALSREFVRRLDATQDIRIKGYAAELGEARRAMAGRDCFGIMEIPDGFQKRAGRLEQNNVILYTDMTLMLRYKAFLMGATDVSQEMGAEIQAKALDSDLPVDVNLDGDPLPIHNVALGNTTSGFDSFVMPGILMLILQQCIILAVGMAGGAMREPRRLLRYNPINEAPSVVLTLISKTLVYCTIMAVPILYLSHYVPLMFAFPMAGDSIEILLLLVPMVLASIFLGFCIQSVVTERETIFVFWVITSVIFLFLSGLTWPRYAMPDVWRWLGDIFPGTWGVEGFIRMNTNGASLSQVSACYYALWILTGVYFTLACVLHRFVIRPRIRREHGECAI